LRAAVFHLEILTTFDGPVGYLPDRKLELLQDETSGLVGVDPAQRDQGRGQVVRGKLSSDAEVHLVVRIEGSEVAEELEQRVQLRGGEQLDVVGFSDLGVRNLCQLVFRPPGADDLDALP